MRSRRRLFRRRKPVPMRLLGMVTLAFAGSFAAAIVTIEWQDSLQPETSPSLSSAAMRSADGLLARTPVVRLAASSSSVSAPDRR